MLSRVSWAVAAAVLCPALLALGDPGCTPSPYQVYWNQYAAFATTDVSQWLITPYNATQTGNECNAPNCTAWVQGLWPTLNDKGAPVNGGVPQAGNLSAHLAALSASVVSWIPDPLWAGSAVFDFENWSPTWEDNNGPTWWHSASYQKYSIALVAAAHPGVCGWVGERD